MPLTCDFKEAVQAHAERDPAFREELLKGGLQCLREDTGKIVLRDNVNAVIGLQKLGSPTNEPPKSLMRMFGADGNPHVRNLFLVIRRIQQHEGPQIEVTTVR